MKLKLICTILILFYIQTDIFAQNEGYYYKYSFTDFLTAKTENPKEYLKSIYKNIKYSEYDRENNFEGTIRLLLINHGFEKNELICINQIGTLQETSIKNLLNANKLFLKKSNEKYMVEITFNFDEEPFEKKKNVKYDFNILGFKRISCGSPKTNSVKETFIYKYPLSNTPHLSNYLQKNKE